MERVRTKRGSDFENGGFPRWRIYFSLYFRNIGANLLGLAIILVLNFFTPMTSEWVGKALLENGTGHYLMMLFPFILILVALLQYQFQSPVFAYLSARARGEQCDQNSEEKVKKRVLNLPIILAATNLAVYIAVPLVLICYFWTFDIFFMDVRIVSLLFFRSVMIGLITACLSFFIVESYARNGCIPLVFPQGGLTRVPGAVRIDVMRRIRLLNLTGTLTPFLILVVTLAFVLWDVMGEPDFSRQLVFDIFSFTLVLCAIFVVIGFRLNRLVGRSMVEPIYAMLDVVAKVEKGDFTQRMRVVSNDELGVLAEAGNRMIQGLAERERVRESFGRYVTPEIRDKILSGEIPLDGEKKTATLLFADLRNFSPFVESNAPEEVILSMREYFTRMEEAVRANDGLVLQYVGDEIEAVFGVPLEVEDHADKAVSAALRMRRGLAELNEKRRLQGSPPFRHGVGICSGPVLAGNTGSRDHPAYALIGDTVNRASRIQELTKELDCDILIARETRELLRAEYRLREKGAYKVKGHMKPVETYELIADDQQKGNVLNDQDDKAEF
ncbi:class 3 adenylate cyclase [Desulfosalsimonas propionicica]|uniref:Class 3 adenylate cyclase n=1 Tax=Desulfosalsimonas propionicica TaxID=332175 RepID=A0A7W0HK83_9BACT|nr:adenylate/guanylate cyclase domain-containing protein [Desulfosalsimonas propionicica]MBA2880908.1 class 3 adenylate cyclase [Desulfosalsimonas propionicica]